MSCPSENNVPTHSGKGEAPGRCRRGSGGRTETPVEEDIGGDS
jgi:hypothetical protein